MSSKSMTAAALAASLALVPAAPVAADGKDFIAGALIGGIVGSQLQKNADRNRTVQTAPAPRQQVVTRAAPSIPATETGRDVQTALNYFGFDAGRVDGQIGQNTRAAISEYQAYLGYPADGSLNDFEQELLLRSYTRAQAGGEQTFRNIAANPDGTRGLLRQYRAEFAQSGALPRSTQLGTQPVTSTY